MSNLFNKFEKSIEKEQSKHPIMTLRKAYTIDAIVSFFIAITNAVLYFVFNSDNMIFSIISAILYLYILHIEIDFKKEVIDEGVQETFSKMRKGAINLIMIVVFAIMLISMFANGLVVPSFEITPELIFAICFIVNAGWKTVFLILDKNETITEDEEE